MRRRIAAAVAVLTAVTVAAAFTSGGVAATSAACDPFQTTSVFAGAVPSPEDVLGFAIGEQQVTSDEIEEYVAAVGDDPDADVETGIAATSVGGRHLPWAIVGDPADVDAAVAAAAELTDPGTTAEQAAAIAADAPAILWVSANVHGNEESGGDASLRVLHELADRTDCVVQGIRDNAVVVILPTQNPDGREDATRRNLNGFDMNRDWFARTQPETDGKLELLRQFPPVLYIDAHEFGTKTAFFPPNADPIYHEVPDLAFGWINDIYGTAIAAEYERQKMPFFNGAPYDLYAVEYGDTVPTVGFHAAGMTFEKHSGDSIGQRAHEQYVMIWASLAAAAGEKPRILEEWNASYRNAYDEGVAGELEPNDLYYDGKTLFQQVPDLTVRHYFLRDDPDRQVELQRLVRRLQRMDVDVYRLDAPLDVDGFRPYGDAAVDTTLPTGTYWIPMAQRQKHWVQAMLHEDPYVPVEANYDVTAWSNALLMNIRGGSAGAELEPDATLVPPLTAPTPPGAPNETTIGLFEIPGSTPAFVSAGAMRYLFDSVWGLDRGTDYRDVTADDVKAGLQGIDVLLVPDGYTNYGLQALGAKGKKALAAWVESGGRFVGIQGGAVMGVRSGVSTAVFQGSHTNAPGTLIRVELDPSSPLAAGVGDTAWVMYEDDDRLSPGLGASAATFPAPGDAAYDVSGLDIGVDELSGTSAIVDEQVGVGQAIMFSFDPNFRAWTDGTQRLLWNALYGSSPAARAAVPSRVRTAALREAERAAETVTGGGKAIRIAVKPADADAVRALLARYGATYTERRSSGRVLFLVENRDGLGKEDHPYALELGRDLQAIGVIAFSVP